MTRQIEDVSARALHNVLNTTQKAALVLFTAPWCTACKPVKSLLQRVLKENPRGPRVLCVDVSDHQDMAMSMGVISLPTVLAYRNGVEVSRIGGAVPYKALQDLVAALEV